LSKGGLVSRESSFLLAALRPPSSHKWLAGAVAASLLIAFLFVLPFKDVRGPSEQAFVPVLDTVLCLCDLTTAVLLYTQFSVVRSRALVALAAGYLFSALIIVPHMLTFPGAFSPTGLLHAGLHSAAWFYVAWRFALPLGVIAYAWLKSYGGRAVDTQQPVRGAVLSSVAAVVVLTLALTVLATVYEAILPPLMVDSLRAGTVGLHSSAAAVIAVTLIAIALLWRRRSSVLDLWLLVVLWAWLIENLLFMMTNWRYSVSWAASRAFGILGSSFVLLVLLYESTRLYARLALSVAAQDRERERQRLTLEVVVGSIAHELHQPLTSIMANGEAGVQLLAQQPPDLREASAALNDIAAEVRRASDVIKSIRDTLAGSAQPTALVDVGQVVKETLALLRTDLQAHDVTVEVEVAAQLPPVQGNKVQLLQVMLNLVTNALESMLEVTNRARVLHVSARAPIPSRVSVTVEDTGVGIAPKFASRIFDPLFTTKARGTGLGLAICRSIIEAHGGRIAVARGPTGGSIFEILLPSHPLSSG
jgi:signal transduction histidine kinase